MSVAVPEFTVEVVARGRELVIRLRGALDVAAAPVLSSCAESAVDAGVGDVVLDVADLAFLDSSGLHTMICIHRRLASSGRHLRIEGAHGPVRRVLEVSGIDRVLRVDVGDRFAS
jgi:anti-sigma B factor antagonist